MLRLMGWMAGVLLPVAGLLTVVGAERPWLGAALIVAGVVALVVSVLLDPPKVEHAAPPAVPSSLADEFQDTWIEEERALLRQADGGSPTSRLNARPNAASDS